MASTFARLIESQRLGDSSIGRIGMAVDIGESAFIVHVLEAVVRCFWISELTQQSRGGNGGLSISWAWVPSRCR